MRLACVQNGDYSTAAKQFATGGTETYNNQFYTVSEFQRFAGENPHLVVSIDAAQHEVTHGNAIWCGIPEPKPLFKWPRRFISASHAKLIIRRVQQFEPTHLLIRCLDVIACELMQWANARGIKTAVIVAARFETTHPACIRFCKLANDKNVLFVANHNRVATETLIECGLEPGKAIAWDLPPTVTPDHFPPRQRAAGSPLQLIYAGALEPAKGVEDFVSAVSLARQSGLDVNAAVCGGGSLLQKLQDHEGVAQGWLVVPGRVAQQEVVRRMAAADFVVVPSRACFNEGLPFVIQEALAVRTPMLLSNHPVFVKYFVPGQGVCIFPEQDPKALADLIIRLFSDTVQYAQLSEKTAQAWESLQCPLKFDQLLDRLSDAWNPKQRSVAPKPALVA